MVDRVHQVQQQSVPERFHPGLFPPPPHHHRRPLPRPLLHYSPRPTFVGDPTSSCAVVPRSLAARVPQSSSPSRRVRPLLRRRRRRRLFPQIVAFRLAQTRIRGAARRRLRLPRSVQQQQQQQQGKRRTTDRARQTRLQRCQGSNAAALVFCEFVAPTAVGCLSASPIVDRAYTYVGESCAAPPAASGFCVSSD